MLTCQVVKGDGQNGNSNGGLQRRGGGAERPDSSPKRRPDGAYPMLQGYSGIEIVDK